jgi:hypothetical protein
LNRQAREEHKENQKRCELSALRGPILQNQKLLIVLEKAMAPQTDRKSNQNVLPRINTQGFKNSRQFQELFVQCFVVIDAKLF